MSLITRKAVKFYDATPEDPALTTEYAGWETAWISCLGLDAIGLALKYTTDIPGACQIRAQITDEDFTDMYEVWHVAEDVAAVDQIIIGSSALPGDGKIFLPFNARYTPFIRFCARNLDENATATLNLKVIGG